VILVVGVVMRVRKVLIGVGADVRVVIAVLTGVPESEGLVPWRDEALVVRLRRAAIDWSRRDRRR
jgi:hypothetical protein